MLPDIAESPGDEKRRRKDSQTKIGTKEGNGRVIEVQWTDKDIEDKFENFVILVIRKALEKYESYKKAGRVKGSDKPHKDTIPVEIVGAVAGAAVGSPFGCTGTGALIGAAVTKFAYDLIHKYFHRKKAKDIVRTIEKFSIDETEILGLFASIGAEIFQACEYQLRPLVETDLQKVAHDVVIGVYNEIKPETWDKDECKSIALSAKSATGKGAKKSKDLLSKAGIYDGKNYFVSDNTDSLEYGFRQPFKNEVVDEKVWRLAKDHEIGSFQPQYFVTDDMTTRVKENAISKTIAADPTMAAKQVSKDMSSASKAVKENDAEFLVSYVEDLQKRQPISNTKDEEVVQLQKILDVEIGNMHSKIAQETDKAGDITERLLAILHNYLNFEKMQELSAKDIEVVKEKISRIAAAVKSKCIGVSNMTPRVPNYLQREGPYEEIGQFLDSPPAYCNKPSRIVCIVGEPFIGKSEMAKSYALSKFQNKNVFWIDVTDQGRIEDCIKEVAKRRKVQISEDMDSTALWQQICSKVDREETLIVFDNAHTYQDIENYMLWHVVPNVLCPKVIVTSRNEESWDTWKCIKLHRFSPDECVRFFEESLKENRYYVEQPGNAVGNVEVLGDTDKDTIKELGRELDFIPKELNKALHEFVKNWKQSKRRKKISERYTLNDYLENLRQKKT